MTEEHELMTLIRLAVSSYVVIFRVNVGKGMTYDGRHFDTGVPKGFSDLFGVRKSDGRAVFIEVKTPQGRIRPEQQNFIDQMKAAGAIAGVCRSIADAMKLIGVEDYEF